MDNIFNSFNNMPIFFQLFSSIGITIVVVFIVFIIIMITEILKEKISDLKYEHTIKHRFDKPPVCPCYCYDCRYYNRKECTCIHNHHNFEYRIGDNMACTFGVPRLKDCNYVGDEVE